MMSLFENNGAEFCPERKNRYKLWRIWNTDGPFVMFIGLNPSTAAENTNDPTIRRVIKFAKNWGYGGVYMLNCFSWISTDPKGLQYTTGKPRNDRALLEAAEKCKEVIFAWGSFSVVSECGRDKELCAMFPNAKTLIVNKDGSPRHPLYVKASTTPVKFGKQ